MQMILGKKNKRKGRTLQVQAEKAQRTQRKYQ